MLLREERRLCVEDGESRLQRRDPLVTHLVRGRGRVRVRARVGVRARVRAGVRAKARARVRVRGIEG